MIFFAIIGIILVILFTYACCKVAGDADKREEEFFRNKMNK